MSVALEKESYSSDDGSSLSTKNEQRQMGAVAMIVNQGGKVFVIYDSETKHMETAGSIGKWKYSENSTIHNEDGVDKFASSWSIPGGGRAVGESFITTLGRELREELGIDELADEQELIKSLVGTLTSFLAAQVGKPESTQIDLFAVRAAVLEFEKLSEVVQAKIENLVDSSEGIQASWVDLIQLKNLYIGLLSDQENRFRANNFRPHTIAAAYIWHLHQVNAQPRAIVDQHNQAGYQFVIEQASSDRFTGGINNGAFHQGRVLGPEQLNQADADFLYGNVASDGNAAL